jgi:hypothetical protein
MSAGHEKIVSHDDREPPSIKNFGLTFAFVFALIAFSPLGLRGEHPRYWALVLGLAFVAAAYLAPNLLKPLNLLWFKLGMLLHNIVNPVVLGIMFLVFITPIALVLRLLGKKLIPLTFESDKASYWIERTPPGPDPDSLRNQF